MAETAGKTAQVWILAGASAMTNSTGAKILSFDNATLDRICDMLEITAFGDAYKNKLAGILDTKSSTGGNLYIGDTTGQDVIIPGNTMFIGVYPFGTGVAGTQVKCICSKRSESYDASGKQTISAEFEGIAAPVALPLRP